MKYSASVLDAPVSGAFPIAISYGTSQPQAVKGPLAVIFYERLMPGSQLANRLQDLNYRVLTVSNLAALVSTVQRESPLLLLVDLASRGEVNATVERILADPATSHLCLIAFAPDNAPELLQAAQKSGVKFAVSEAILANHLPYLLDQALAVD